MQDVRYAWRQMRTKPGFALIAVLTLGLGVGAAAAVFSVMDAVMLRPLPFDRPERIVLTQTRSGQGYTQPFSYPSYLDLRRTLGSFKAFAGWETTTLNLEAASGPVALHAVRATDNFFDVFGVRPVLGRTFLPGEDDRGRDTVAVLSYEVWQGNFAGEAGVVGKTLRLDGLPYVVVGVMPAGFRFPLSLKGGIYTPIHALDRSWGGRRGAHWLQTIARLKDGVSVAQGQEEFSAGLHQLGVAYPDTDEGRTGRLVGVGKAMLGTGAGTTAGALWTLVGAVLALLAIACINVAGLLLARAVKREREIAMRAAVGATRARLLRQMVTESLLLAGMSTVVGVGLAYALLAAMRTYLITALARGAEVHLNGAVLAAACGFAAVTSVLASLVPAVRLSGVDPNRALKAGGGAGAGRSQHRLRASFLVAQVMLSLTLLIVAGLLLETLSRARGTKLGFDPERVLALELELSPANYAGRDMVASFYRPLLDRVRQVHGVEGAGVISLLPIQTWGSNTDVHISGQPPYAKDAVMLAESRMVSEGYFAAMGIGLKGGRMLSPSLDRAPQKAATMVVNEAFRRQFFSGGGNPLGAHLDDAKDAEGRSAIVGVMGDVRQDLNQPPLAEMDYLIESLPLKEQMGNIRSMTLVVRSEGDPRALIPELRAALHGVDATVPFHVPEVMTEVVSDQMVMERMESWLFGVFAVMAVTLAMVGLYGLISHEVEIGARDIGVRMALGATREGVMRMVMGRVAGLVALGAGAGLVLTFALKRAVASVVTMEYGRDGGVMVGLAVGLLALGVVAAFFPARRAASIEPMEALRAE